MNPKCKLSSQHPDLDRLYKALDQIELALRHKENVDDLLPPLGRFAKYFQTEGQCAGCGQPVQREIRPRSGMVDDVERAKIELCNEALRAWKKFQALQISRTAAATA